MGLLVFLVTAAVAVASALGLVLKRNPIHGALFLIVNLASVAVLYLLLGGPFLAWIQVIVYAGAIMVLFVFALMVLIPGKEETGPDPLRRVRLIALPFGGLLLLPVLLMVRTYAGAEAPGERVVGTVEVVGHLLFTEYLFPFELTSVLLLAALVGVLALAKRGDRPNGANGSPRPDARRALRWSPAPPLDLGGNGERPEAVEPRLNETPR